MLCSEEDCKEKLQLPSERQLLLQMRSNSGISNTNAYLLTNQEHHPADRRVVF